MIFYAFLFSDKDFNIVDDSQKVASIAIVPHQDEEEDIIEEVVNDNDSEMQALLNSYDSNDLDSYEDEVEEESLEDQE